MRAGWELFPSPAAAGLISLGQTRLRQGKSARASLITLYTTRGLGSEDSLQLLPRAGLVGQRGGPPD